MRYWITLIYIYKYYDRIVQLFFIGWSIFVIFAENLRLLEIEKVILIQQELKNVSPINNGGYIATYVSSFPLPMQLSRSHHVQNSSGLPKDTIAVQDSDGRGDRYHKNSMGQDELYPSVL